MRHCNLRDRHAVENDKFNIENDPQWNSRVFPFSVGLTSTWCWCWCCARYACIRHSGIILTHRLPLCQICASQLALRSPSFNSYSVKLVHQWWNYDQLQAAVITVKKVTWLVVTEVRSESFGLVTERRHYILVLCAVAHIFAYWTSAVSVTHVIFFIVECSIARFLCAMRALYVYSTFGHHPHP